MEQLIATIEKGQPLFNAIARNKYLKAIRDGFISVIPIIIFSSIFCLVASVPNIWGFYWPDDINNALWKCYNYSMGILAIACAATTAKHFADAQNRDLPKNSQINFISCMCAAIIGFLLLSSTLAAVFMLGAIILDQPQRYSRSGSVSNTSQSQTTSDGCQKAPA